METLTMEAVRGEDLTDADVLGIHEVMQDMWATKEWMGELATCSDCGRVFSKEEAYPRLAPDVLQRTTVAKIMAAGGVPACPDCGGKDARLAYGEANIARILDRTRNGVDSFLVICRSSEHGIVGFEEAYVDSLDRIFDLDLADHYRLVGVDEIRSRVGRILGHVPDSMFLLSSIGLLPAYRGFPNLFGIMKTFTESLPDGYLGTPGLTELNRWGVTHKMNEGIRQGISLGIETDPDLASKMVFQNSCFNGELIAYEDPVRTYREYFSGSMRDFLRMIRSSGNRERVENVAQPTVLRA